MTLLSGTQVITFRRRLGLSQRDLADRLGVNQATVSRWEQGLTTPSAEIWDHLLSLRYGTGILQSMALNLLVSASDQRRILMTQELVVVGVSRGLALSLGCPSSSLVGRAYEPLMTDNLRTALRAARASGLFDGAMVGMEVWGWEDRTLLDTPMPHHSFWSAAFLPGTSPLLYWDMEDLSAGAPDTPGGFRPYFLDTL